MKPVRIFRGLASSEAHIWRFYAFMRPYVWQMGLFLSLVALSVVAESIRPYFLKQILDFAAKNDSSTVLWYFFLFGFSVIGANLISALANYLGDKVCFPFARTIRETVFQKMLDLDFAYHVNKSTGSIISAFKRGDNAVFDLYQNIHQELFRVLIYLLVSVYLLFILSPWMALSLLVLFGANVALIWWLVKINLRTRTEFNDAEDNVSAVITDSVINYETVKYFSAESKERQRLSSEFDIWMKKLWNFGNSFRLMDITIGTTSGVGMMFILWQALSKLNHGISLGDLVMVSGILTSFYYQFFNLFFRIRSIAKNMADLERYFNILGHSPQVKDPQKSRLPKKVAGNVSFEHVSFVYPKNPDRVLDDVSLSIKSGQQIAFVGRSGAGKTTLIKLLLRFYDPTEGSIKLDGVDIRDMSKSQLRSFMGVVPQEPIMFNNTLKYNLSYGKSNATQKEIESAAKQANILEFIESLPEKWDTHVGERGIKLSGGQKQRLAIARALLASPKVLIFDEATSSLDSESELKIQSALQQVSHTRTVIIVAHRFSTIRHADKIFVLSGGVLVETGKHDELMAKKGVYALLWSLQSQGKLLEVN